MAVALVILALVFGILELISLGVVIVDICMKLFTGSWWLYPSLGAWAFVPYVLAVLGILSRIGRRR